MLFTSLFDKNKPGSLSSAAMLHDENTNSQDVTEATSINS